MTQPNPLKIRILDPLPTQSNPTQPNLWVNPTYGQLCRAFTLYKAPSHSQQAIVLGAFSSLCTLLYTLPVAAWLSAAITCNGLDQRSCSASGPVSTWMGDRLWTGTPSRIHGMYSQPPRSTQPSIPPEQVNRVPTCPAGVWRVHLCRLAGNTV